MAETFLALEISEQKIKYVILEKKGRGLVLSGTGVSNVSVDPSAPGRLSQFIKETAAANNIKVSRLFLTLNRQDVVIHQITLPKTSDADLEIFIPAEIERVPAFSDRPYDYIYRMYEAENNKNRIIFVALQEEWLKYLLAEVEDTHIPCRELEILPLNFTKLLFAPEFMEGVQGLIVLGQRSTFLIVFEKQQIKYFYSTNTGKDSLFPVSGGAKLDKMACARWADELKRVFKAYLLDVKKESLEKIWLLWDQDGGAGAFDKYVREELNLDARRLGVEQIPSNIEWGSENANPILLLTCVPVIHAFNNIQPHFSLKHFLRSLQLEKQLHQIITATVVFIAAASLIFGATIFHFSRTEAMAKAGIVESQAKTKELEQKSGEILRVRNGYLAARDQLLAQATYVKLLNRMSWSEVLSVVALELPEELSLTSFKVNESGLVTFNGNAFRMESISALLRKIETSAILDRGKFSYLTEQELEQKKIYSFGILANIKLAEDKSNE